MQYVSSVTIERTIEDVFGYLSTIENAPDWQNSVLDARQVSSAPLGLGMRYVALVKLLGRRLKSSGTVTAWSPPHQFTLRTTSPLLTTIQFTLTPEDKGTRVMAVAEIEPNEFLPMAAPLVAHVVPGASQIDLETAKMRLERLTQADSDVDTNSTTVERRLPS